MFLLTSEITHASLPVFYSEFTSGRRGLLLVAVCSSDASVSHGEAAGKIASSQG